MRVGAVLRHQLVVRAALGNRAAVEDDDLVRIPDRRKPMGDDNPRHVPLRERLDDLVFRHGVERTRRLAGDQHLRVGDEYAGDLQPLPHAARELRPAQRGSDTGRWSFESSSSPCGQPVSSAWCKGGSPPR